MTSIPPARSAVDGRRDDRPVLEAERAALAGVRIEPGDGEPGTGDGEAAPEVVRDDPRGLDDQLLAEHVRHVAERHVDGDRDRPQLGSGEHHHRSRRYAGPGRGQRAEELGVAGMPEAGGVERLLADRIGHHGRGVARPDVADGAGDGLDDRRWRSPGPPGPARRLPRPASGTTGSASSKTAAASRGRDRPRSGSRGRATGARAATKSGSARR